MAANGYDSHASYEYEYEDAPVEAEDEEDEVEPDEDPREPEAATPRTTLATPRTSFQAAHTCPHVYVSGSKRGTQCGRYVRKVDRTLCYVHHRQTESRVRKTAAVRSPAPAPAPAPVPATAAPAPVPAPSPAPIPAPIPAPVSAHPPQYGGGAFGGSGPFAHSDFGRRPAPVLPPSGAAVHGLEQAQEQAQAHDGFDRDAALRELLAAHQERTRPKEFWEV